MVMRQSIIDRRIFFSEQNTHKLLQNVTAEFFLFVSGPKVFNRRDGRKIIGFSLIAKLPKKISKPPTTESFPFQFFTLSTASDLKTEKPIKYRVIMI